jgi:SpoVK/Ycf46/Vps4 family AAA+-type ATPase
MQYFPIIQALCRSALVTPNNAIIQQVERLIQSLQKDGFKKEADSLSGLLTTANKTIEMAPSKIERSFLLLGGEELTSKTHVPVDKESSTPLAEIIFTKDLPSEPPLFSYNVQLAIESILREWSHFEKLSNILANPSRSCLIYGAPGTGKTHLALWIAKQINLPIVLARLDGLMSSFLGTTSRNIGNLFSFATRYRCILLLDEFDAMAKLRNDPQEVGEIKRVVNTLLQNLDNRKNIGFTIGVTNHESLLDPAIWRRFEVQLEIPKPSFDVIQAMIRKWQAPLEFDDTELKFLTWAIENSSGADIESMIKWLKKESVLETESHANLVEKVRKFALLNSGRVDEEKKKILSLSDEEVVAALLNDTKYLFKQKDLATLVDKSPSALNKILSKLK